MRWFGENWHAPICDGCAEIPVPIGLPCIMCGDCFSDRDRGVEVPFIEHEGGPAAVAYYHLVCLLRCFVHVDGGT